MFFNLLLQYLLPQHMLSRLVAKIANCRIRAIKNFFIGQYCKFYHIDMKDVLETDPLNYQTFNDFFGRTLKPGSRPITGDKKTIISPVDGKVLQVGGVNKNQIINKALNYRVEKIANYLDEITN
jgi:phosphatidylserine decarboxylase